MKDNEYKEIDELNPLSNKKKSKHKEILDEIKMLDIDDDQHSTTPNIFLPSSMLRSNSDEDTQEKSSKDKDNDSLFGSDDDWIDSIMNIKITKNKHGKHDSLFEGISGKRKKKKKKKKDEPTDYNKEFETETALIKNLLQDQSKFTDSLQQEYDKMKSTKSSARGVNKTMTDLIENINGARSLSMQLVEKKIHLKKLIAELTMKEKKELSLGDGENDMSNFASTYLHKMISERGNLMNGTGAADVGEFSEDELYNALSEGLIDVDRSEDVDRYLKYENRNITTYISVNNDNIEDFNFISKDEEGYIIDDYPTPQVSSISVNRSTNIATDNYGKKYPILWR